MTVEKGYYVPSLVELELTDGYIAEHFDGVTFEQHEKNGGHMFHVYKCHVLGAKALTSLAGYKTPCLGGGSGVASCAEGRTGIACGVCADGYEKFLE